MRRPQTGLVTPPADDAEVRQNEFERLFREHYEPLCRFAYRFLRDASAAEDIVQDVFGRVWSDGRRIIVQTSMRAYLYAAVRNGALNSCKHAAVVAAWQRDAGSDVSMLHSSPIDPDDALDLRVAAERLAEGLAALPPRQAEAMRLRWHEELTHAEIAEALGISIKGVEKHLARGMAALREKLAPQRELEVPGSVVADSAVA